MQLLHTPLELDLRKRLYVQVHTQVVAAHKSGEPMTITIPLPTQTTRLCGPLKTKLVYTLPTPRGDGQPNLNAAGSVIPSRPQWRRQDRRTKGLKGAVQRTYGISHVRYDLPRTPCAPPRDAAETRGAARRGRRRGRLWLSG
jgi:hypothetical protein